MRPIEIRIVSAALARIRTHKTTPATRRFDLDARSDRPRKAKRRAVLFTDFEAVATLKRRQGLSLDSLANWHRLWQKNPALSGGSKAPCLGWVLESEDGIVGYLGSIPLLYQFGDRILSAAATTGLAVDPAYRALTPSLVSPFFHQKGVDLYLATSATEITGKITKAFKGEFVPQREYGTVLFWVLDPVRFASAVRKKIGAQGVFGDIAEKVISIALRGDTGLRRRWPRCTTNGLQVADMHVRDIGPEFESLWIHKLAERKRLLAFRTPDILRWHFDMPGDRRTTRVLCCYSGGRLRGYAIIQTEIDRDTGLQRSSLADMLLENDAPHLATRLFAEAYEYAEGIGSHVLEVLGFPQFIRNTCLEWKPYSREYPACPFLYKASDQALQAELANENAWYASPYDGDTTLSARAADTADARH